MNEKCFRKKSIQRMLIASCLAAACGAVSVSAEDSAAVQPADYYRYVRDVYLSEQNLAPTEPIHMLLNDGLEFNLALMYEGETGLIGADVRDYDGDGGYEMILINLNQPVRFDTYFRTIEYGTEMVSVDTEQRAFEISIDYLDYKDGEIYEACSDMHMGILATDGWGMLNLGIEKVGDTYYLFSESSAETMSSYGRQYFVLAKFTGTGLTKCYFSPFDDYNEETANELFGITPINLNELSLSQLIGGSASLSLYENTPESQKAHYGERLLCTVHIEYPEWGGDDLIERITDFTDLRRYLENEGADWELVVLPEGEILELPDAADMPELASGFAVESFMTELDMACGTTFASNGLDQITEENGVYKCSLNSGDLSLSLFWNAEDGKIVWAGVYDSKYDPEASWYTVKDYLLASPVFGMDQAAVEPLKGATNWNDYVNGVQIGDYKCSIHNIMSPSMTIEAVNE